MRSEVTASTTGVNADGLRGVPVTENDEIVKLSEARIAGLIPQQPVEEAKEEEAEEATDEKEDTGFVAVPAAAPTDDEAEREAAEGERLALPPPTAPPTKNGLPGVRYFICRTCARAILNLFARSLFQSANACRKEIWFAVGNFSSLSSLDHAVTNPKARGSSRKARSEGAVRKV